MRKLAICLLILLAAVSTVFADEPEEPKEEQKELVAESVEKPAENQPEETDYFNLPYLGPVQKLSVGAEFGTRAVVSLDYKITDRIDIRGFFGYQYGWKDLEGMEVGVMGSFKFFDFGMKIRGSLGFSYGDSYSGFKWISPQIGLSAEFEKPGWFMVYVRGSGGPYFATDGSRTGVYISVCAGIGFYPHNGTVK